MRIINRIKRAFRVAYSGKRFGIGYESEPTGGTTKAIAETAKEVLVIYAAYSDLGEKFLKLFASSMDLSILGRVTTSALGLFVCGHILLSVKKEENNGRRFVYSYSRFPRRISFIVIGIVFIAFCLSIRDLAKTRKTYIEAYSSSNVIPRTAWEDRGDGGYPQARKYRAEIIVPAEDRTKAKQIKVFIEPYNGYRLIDVSAVAAKAVELSEEPLEVGKFEDTRSEWLFPQFDNTKHWELLVTVGKVSPDLKFLTEGPPMRGTIYLYE